MVLEREGREGGRYLHMDQHLHTSFTIRHYFQFLRNMNITATHSLTTSPSYHTHHTRRSHTNEHTHSGQSSHQLLTCHTAHSYQVNSDNKVTYTTDTSGQSWMLLWSLVVCSRSLCTLLHAYKTPYHLHTRTPKTPHGIRTAHVCIYLYMNQHCVSASSQTEFYAHAIL